MKHVLKDIPKETLTREKENDCSAIIQKYKQGALRDEAINTLVLHNLREAFHYARRCSRESLCEDELFSLCYDALLRSAKNFKPQGTRFFAYAKQAVRGMIYRIWRDRRVVKKISMSQCLPLDAIRYDEPEVLSSGDEPTPPSTKCLEAYQMPDWEGICLRDAVATIAPQLQKLNKQEQAVIRLRYEGDYTFEEIGGLLGSSRSAIWGTHRRALKKLRSLAASKPRPFSSEHSRAGSGL
jgi:RNA polymerase sigma factor (sigma-70 family)